MWRLPVKSSIHLYHGTAFGAVNHHLHRQRRLAVNPLFSKQAVTSIEPRIRASAERMSEYLDRGFQEQPIINTRVTFLAWSAAAITSYVFDKSFNLLASKEKALELYSTFQKIQLLWPFVKQCVWVVPLALMLPLWVVNRVLPSVTPKLLGYKVRECLVKTTLSWSEQALAA